MGWVDLWESKKLCQCGVLGSEKGGYMCLIVICCEIEMTIVKVGGFVRVGKEMMLLVVTNSTSDNDRR